MAEQNTISGTDILACQPYYIKGKVTFGKGCVIHPGVSIIADNGPIVIGDYNIIEERTLIQNKGKKDSSGQFIEAPLEIGSYNIFEMDSTIEYCKIGNSNKFEHKCHIENGAVIGNGCLFGALSKFSGKIKLDDESCVYDNGKIVKNLDFNQDLHMREVLALQDLLVQKMGKAPQKK